jgi:hypothetical protein
MPANPARLGNDAHEWGKYYQYDPQIMAGELAGGHSALTQGSLLMKLINTLPEAPWTNLSENIMFLNALETASSSIP